MIPINTQAPEKRDQSTGEFLDVHSIFHTIQGEGPYVGRPAVFIRLAGCNLQCPGCDTAYSSRKRMGLLEILTAVQTAIYTRPRSRFALEPAFEREIPRPLIVITGGEPFRQSLFPLIWKLSGFGYKVQIESNGTLAPLAGPFEEWPPFEVVVSPKAGKVAALLHHRIIAYKYVLSEGAIDPADGLPTSVLGLPAAPARPHQGFAGTVYVQPAEHYWPMVDEGERVTHHAENDANLVAAIDVAMTFGYTLCLQVHKMIHME